MNITSSKSPLVSIQDSFVQIKEMQKNLKEAKRNIKNGPFSNYIANVEESARPQIFPITHRCTTEYIVIPQYFNEYAFVVCDLNPFSGKSEEFYTELSLAHFTRKFSIPEVNSLGGSGGGRIHCPECDGRFDGIYQREGLGSGLKYQKILGDHGIKILFHGSEYLVTIKDKFICRPVSTWRELLTQEFGQKYIRMYIDPWMKVGVRKTKQTSSSYEPTTWYERAEDNWEARQNWEPSDEC